MKITSRWYALKTGKGLDYVGNGYEGVTKTAQELLSFERDMMKAAAHGAYAAANDVMELSIERAPLEDGYIEASAFAAKPEFTTNTWRVVFGYGGDAAGPYLFRQHEVEMNHPGERAIAKGVTKVGQSKFLTSAYNDKMRAILDTISGYVNLAMSGKRPGMPEGKVREMPYSGGKTRGSPPGGG